MRLSINLWCVSVSLIVVAIAPTTLLAAGSKVGSDIIVGFRTAEIESGKGTVELFVYLTVA